jgi:dTMP kinase
MQSSQHKKPYDGFFITLEGGDGSGKTTLARSLVEHLQKNNCAVVKTREPGGSKLSEHIRTLLLDPTVKVGICEKAELLLFLAARAQHIEEIILPALRAGKIVVCERFNDSTIAYQGYARHLGMEHVEKLCMAASSQLEPDVTFFLDVDPSLGLKRAKQGRGDKLDRLEQEQMQFHSEVRQGFLHLAVKYPARISVIDASTPQEEVLRSTLHILSQHLKSTAHSSCVCL